MEIQASRLRARIGPRGEPVLLADQDRARWDQLLIAPRPRRARRAEAAQRRARPLRAAGRDRRLPRPGRDAPRRPTGRGSSRSTTRSPSSPPLPGRRAEPRRGRVDGVRPGGRRSSSSTRSRRSPRCAAYHLLPSVRGDLLVRLGRLAEAREEFERAADLAQRQRAGVAALARGCLRHLRQDNRAARPRDSNPRPRHDRHPDDLTMLERRDRGAASASGDEGPPADKTRSRDRRRGGTTWRVPARSPPTGSRTQLGVHGGPREEACGGSHRAKHVGVRFRVGDRPAPPAREPQPLRVVGVCGRSAALTSASSTSSAGRSPARRPSSTA